MNTIVDKIREASPIDVFSDQELKLLFPNLTPAARHNRLKRALAKGELTRLTRGLYSLSKKYQRHGVNLFAIGHLLYGPSYLSLESALRHYELIPEMVLGITMVTPSRSKQIETPMGVFSFMHLPLHIFRRDFFRQKEGAHSFFIASPLKALLDLVYLQQRKYKSLSDLENDLRLDLARLKSELQTMPNRDLLEYKKLYSRPRVSKVIDLIIWDLL